MDTRIYTVTGSASTPRRRKLLHARPGPGEVGSGIGASGERAMRTLLEHGWESFGSDFDWVWRSLVATVLEDSDPKGEQVSRHGGVAASWHGSGQGAGPETRASSAVRPFGPVADTKGSLPVRCGTQAAWQSLGPTGHLLWRCPQMPQLCWCPLYTPPCQTLVQFLHPPDKRVPLPAGLRLPIPALLLWPRGKVSRDTTILTQNPPGLSARGQTLASLVCNDLFAEPRSSRMGTGPQQSQPGTCMVHVEGLQTGHAYPSE